MVVLSAAAAGCVRKAPGPRTVVDEMGRTVAVPDTILRVITLAPSLTELVFAAGAGQKLVAVSSADNFPPEITGLDRLDAHPVNFEAVVARQPDVVLLNAEVNRTADADRLAALGAPAFMTATQGIREVAADVQLLGRLLGTEEAANAQAALLVSAIDTLVSRTAQTPLEDRPSVLFLIGYNTLYAFGEGSYIHELIELAGGVSVTASLQQNPVLNEEFVLAEDPDYILISSNEAFRVADLVDAHPAFRDLAAVKSGNVRTITADHVLRPGPRLISGAYELATILHPELLSDE